MTTHFPGAIGDKHGEKSHYRRVVMQAGMGLGALAGGIHPYPTLAEAIRQCGDAYNRERLTPTVKGIISWPCDGNPAELQ